MVVAERQAGWLEAETGSDRLLIKAGGAWTVASAAVLDAALAALHPAGVRHATIDLSRVEALDTAGCPNDAAPCTRAGRHSDGPNSRRG